MKLHTHQLKITSAVRAEQEELTGDIANNTVCLLHWEGWYIAFVFAIFYGYSLCLCQVDTASAMLSAARSLMNTVVLVVKTCYLASSAIARAEGIMPVCLISMLLTVRRPLPPSLSHTRCRRR